jgi:16S rRNA (cytosine1402-N4)-methyltransferase
MSDDKEHNNIYHKAAMLEASVEALQIKESGTYVDLTFGGGGHAKAMLALLGKNGRVVAFDHDADAKLNADAICDTRLTFIQNNFRFLHNHLRHLGIGEVAGVLGDLGVSWHQFDTAQRGFSFRFEASLDMRMNRESKQTAADIINTYAAEDLKRVFSLYGDLNNAAQTAALIVQARDSQGALSTVGDLLRAIEKTTPRFDANKYLAKVFQALRIEVNQEMMALEQVLSHCAKSITTGGRLVMITYHSLEDRMVKNFIRSGNISGTMDKDIYGNCPTPFVAVNKKVITPSEQETADNPRVRSAKMRIAEKS